MTSNKNDYPWLKSYPEDLEYETEINPKPLTDILTDSAKNFPNNNAIDFYGKKLTFAQTDELSSKLAKGLQKNGIIKGQKIVLLLPNCPQFVIAYYAILKIGAVVVNCNPLYTQDELTKQINDCNADAIITLNLKQFIDKGLSLLRTTALEKIIVSNFEDSLPFVKGKFFKAFKSKEIAKVDYAIPNIISYDKLLKDHSTNFIQPKIDILNDAAVLQYTGGTTGKAKAAILTHKNLYSNVYQTGLWFNKIEDGQEKMLAVLPFFHVFSMTAVMNFSILKACEIIIHPRLEISALLKDIHKKKATLLPGVPTLFSAISKFADINKYNLTSLKYCISGGAALPLKVKEDFEKITKSVVTEGYGLSECSPVATVMPTVGEYKEGSIGLPLPNTIVEIRGLKTRRLKKTGEIGEICIKGPQVMKGYLHDKKDKSLRKDRLHTGDLGYIDDEGYVFVVDRIKEMIISNGFNIYPREIEEQIYTHPAVLEVAVIGVENKNAGQKVKAVIVLKKDTNLDKRELLSFLKSKLARYKLPREVEFRKKLPKTLIGKISKKDL